LENQRLHQINNINIGPGVKCINFSLDKFSNLLVLL
jgi:hypothetical protein